MNRKWNRLLVLIIVFPILTSLIISIYSVSNSIERMDEYDEATVKRVKLITYEGDLSQYVNTIEDMLNSRDCVIILDSSGNIIESANIVIDSYKEEVHNNIYLQKGRLEVNKKQSGVDTYVTRINISLDHTYRIVNFDEDFTMYLIPFWRIIKTYLLYVAYSLSIGFFVSAFFVILCWKDLDTIRKMEMDDKRVI